jgi:hypothetical protein
MLKIRMRIVSEKVLSSDLENRRIEIALLCTINGRIG